MLQFNEGHFPSAAGMVCGNQTGLVEAVGSVDLNCEGARVAETFHPLSRHTASWHCCAAFQRGPITPLLWSKGCLIFDHYTNVRSMYSMAGSPAGLAGHVLAAQVPVGLL